MAVGIIAAQSIASRYGSSPCGRSHRRHGEHRPGSERHQGQEGGHRQVRPHAFVQERRRQEHRAHRNGEISILDPKGRELEKFEVPTPHVARLENRKSKRAPSSAVGPHSIPILAEVSGKVRYEDVVEGETMRLEEGRRRHRPPPHHRPQGRIAPQIVVEDADGSRSTSTTCRKRLTSSSRGESPSAPARSLPKRPAKPRASRTSPAVCRG